MLNCLTVSALLKTVILVTSFCVVVGFSLNTWDSWGRLQVASRIAVIADASANIFKAMHNLRTDRSTTNRLLNSDAPMDAGIEKYLRNIRDTEMPAMGKALGLLGGLEFAQQQTLVPEFDRVFKTMTVLQKEFWEAVAKPKAQRRPELAKEYMAAANAMLEVLEKLSGALAAVVNHQDATIDQLLAIKQIAWLLRNTAGEASLIVSTGLSSGKLSPEARLAYTKYSGGIDAAWGALGLTASGMTLPPAISSAIAATKTAYFEPSYLALRDRLLTQTAAGEKTELTANQWTPVTVGRLGAAVAVAEAALDAAKDHAAHLRSTAEHSLAMQLALVVGVLALAFGAMAIVTRRVIKPLHTMRDAMLKVAAGDLHVDTGYAARHDEIGALAGALETTEEISEQIADIQKVAGEAIDAIKNIGGIIGEVNEVATAIAAAVQQQGAATQEITRSTQFAAQGTKNVSDNITGVKADADAAAAAAEDVKQASQTLETQSQQLGNQVTDFLGKIRAA